MASRGSIPGYFFDEEKRRYFPVQPNHIAPKSAAYSQSAVTASTEAEKLKKIANQRDHRVRSGRISRSNLRTPFLDLTLGNQLGLPQIKTSAAQAHGRYYASELSWTTAIPDPSRRLIGFFTLNSSLHVSSYHTDPQNLMLQTAYCNSTAAEGIDRPNAWNYLGLMTRPKRMAATRAESFVVAGGRSLQLYRSDLHLAHEWHNFHDRPLEYFTDLSISPNGTQIAITRGSAVTRVHMELASAVVEYKQTVTRDWDYMVTSYIDDNILLAGARSGGVKLLDSRVNAHVHRLQHSSAVNGIHARAPNDIIVSGLQSVALYDLRYIRDRPTPYHPPKCGACQNQRSRKARLNRRACPVEKFASTQPLVKFHTPQDRHSHHYTDAGKSLAYIPSLDIAVVASHSTSSIQAHDSRKRISTKADRITLYHASTGRVLPSVFDNMVYDSDILQVGVHRMRDGPESILLCTEDKLQEFRVDLPKDKEYNGTVVTLAGSRFPADAELGMAEKWEKGDLGPL